VNPSCIGEFHLINRCIVMMLPILYMLLLNLLNIYVFIVLEQRMSFMKGWYSVTEMSCYVMLLYVYLDGLDPSQVIPKSLE